MTLLKEMTSLKYLRTILKIAPDALDGGRGDAAVHLRHEAIHVHEELKRDPSVALRRQQVARQPHRIRQILQTRETCPLLRHNYPGHVLHNVISLLTHHIRYDVIRINKTRNLKQYSTRLNVDFC